VVNSVPQLETERLILRGYRLNDFPHCLALWSDPEVTRFIGGKPSTEEETWARFVRYVGQWSLMGFGSFATFERSSGRFVGEIGVFEARRALAPSFAGAPEAGWALVPEFHRRGLACEGLAAVLAWCDVQAVPRTVCMIDPGNNASRKVALGAGFKPFADATYRDAPVTLFERFKG
jgi:RimJ/RimL family protein N-acetyltransferase